MLSASLRSHSTGIQTQVLGHFFPHITQCPQPSSQDLPEGPEGRVTTPFSSRPLGTLPARAAPCPAGWGAVLCPHLLSVSTVTHSQDPGKHSPVCCRRPASSSPPPHLLTETRLLLFLTLQLPLAWGSPLYPPTPCPTGCHQSVIPRAVLQPECPGGCSGCPGRAGLWGKQNKTVAAQSPNSPTPNSFRTCNSQPALLLPAILGSGGGRVGDFWGRARGMLPQEPELGSLE